MFYLLDENSIIIGVSDLLSNCPSQFMVFESELNLHIESVYFDGKDIIPKPPKPQGATWDSNNNNWVVFPLKKVIVYQDWDKLISLLQNSPEWGRAYTASERTLKANTAFTTLLTTLTTLKKTETLEFALAKLRESMSAISGLGDFSAEEIASINQKLIECGFELQLNV